MKYPLIEIDLSKLAHNVKRLKELTDKENMELVAVTKVTLADHKIAEVLVENGIRTIGDSRIKNFIKLSDLNVSKLLLRLPAISEVADVVRYTDTSLNSSLKVIRLLNHEAAKMRKIHHVILMIDLGDLREGMWLEDMPEIFESISEILKMSNIDLMGLGTNLTCYGGVIPTEDRLEFLSFIQEEVKKRFNYKIPVISAGNSSAIPLLREGWRKEWNQLRVGEALYFGRDTSYREPIEGMHEHVFTLKAEVIEVYDKPSLPIGTIGTNAFGEKPTFTDRGFHQRIILNVGRQDVLDSQLTPVDETIEIIGASSDHLIVTSPVEYKLGDIIPFYVDYGGLLNAMSSDYIEKVYKKSPNKS